MKILICLLLLCASSLCANTYYIERVFPAYVENVQKIVDSLKNNPKFKDISVELRKSSQLSVELPNDFWVIAYEIVEVNL